MRIYGKTHIGMVRENNQDSFKIKNNGELFLCVVCDGMGGAAGGSVASSTACEVFTDKFFSLVNENPTTDNYCTLLEEAVSHANTELFNLAQKDKNLQGMGTTLCSVATDGKKVNAISIGDSRIYMINDGELIQISHDHSYVQALVDCGAITKDESVSHPQKNIITRAVGTSMVTECDCFNLDFTADGFLICSDGLTNYVPDEILKKIIGENFDDIEKLTDTLIKQANDNGGGDNITVLVILKDKE